MKFECENPTGNMKDRMAPATVSRAEAEGRLKPGDTVVEYSGDSTGASIVPLTVDSGLKYLSTGVYRSNQGA